MHDLFFVGFLGALLALGFKRPFLFVLAYCYVDIVSPQRLSYYLLNTVPVSLICFGLAILGWIVTDDKRDVRIAPRQLLMLMLLAWAGYTTWGADFHVEALAKWDWVWKALVFAIFLPLTLRTRLRIEALCLTMVLCASSIIVVGGLKTVASGGGYGSLNLMVDDNTGLYEGSIISTVAIAIVPIIFWLAKFGTIFPNDWRVKLYSAALAFACLMIPIGTQARTGLICIGVLVVLTIRSVKHRIAYIIMLGLAGLIAVPLLPASYTQRMDTIKGYQSDESAGTRLAVWAWTWDYVKRHPFGGGFEAYRQNKLTINIIATQGDANSQQIQQKTDFDEGRAYHSSYFEMLGEQGFPGLAMWLMLNLGGLFRMEVLRRRFLKANGDQAWIAPLATALQHCNIIYMIGSLFVGIAFQPFIMMLFGCQIGFDTYVGRRRKEAAWRPLREKILPAGGTLAA